MNDQQDVLSKSYSESISSELHKRLAEEDDHATPSLRRYYSNSIKSSVSNNPHHYYTDPVQYHKNDRRGSMATLGDSSSYYDPIAEEEERDFFGSQHSSDDEDDVDKATPLPKVQMAVLAIILFSEPLTSSILFPFIYFMVGNSRKHRCYQYLYMCYIRRLKIFISLMMKKTLVDMQAGSVSTF